MGPRKSGIAVAIAIITVGAGWLLNSVGVLPAIEWVWTLFLAVAGVLTVGLLGWDKVTVVVGPFLLVAALFSILRQTGKLPVNYEIPLLVILLGMLLLVSILLPLKRAGWLHENGEDHG